MTSNGQSGDDVDYNVHEDQNNANDGIKCR